ncbi:MAG: hypothetical protein K2L02_06020 [Clostridia bacterium]|nr:hypothetical protein [Clostridia bacterium]
MEVSTMIGTEIFSPAGEKLGFVKTVYLSKDRKKITCLLCVDESDKEEETDDEFVMPYRAVLSVKDVIIAKKSRISKTIGAPAPVGASVYSDTGEALGTLCEILVGDSGPVYIVTKNGVRTPYPDDVVTIGEALMISTESGKKNAALSVAEEPAVIPTPAPAVGYSLGDIDFSAVVNAANAGAGIDRLNLLGRQVKITVRDKNGDLIAESGEKITPEILSLARKNNLLLRLTVNTLTNIV